MQNKTKRRRGSNAAIRSLYKALAQAKNTTTANAQLYGASLPFSEAELLSELDAWGAHADELAQPSATEWNSY